MKKLLLILSLLLSGCIYQKADTVDIIKAVEFCGYATKIHHITIEWGGYEQIVCISGTEIRVN